MQVHGSTNHPLSGIVIILITCDMREQRQAPNRQLGHVEVSVTHKMHYNTLGMVLWPYIWVLLSGQGVFLSEIMTRLLKVHLKQVYYGVELNLCRIRSRVASHFRNKNKNLANLEALNARTEVENLDS